MEQDSIKQLAAATETHPYGKAPKAVLMALAALLGADETVAVCAGVDSAPTWTTWQVAAITERHVIVVKAGQKVASWALGFGTQEAESLDAWAVPIGTLSGVSVIATNDRTDQFSPNDWRWSTAYRVSFAGGLGFSVPVQQQPPMHKEEKRVEAFVRELLKRM